MVNEHDENRPAGNRTIKTPRQLDSVSAWIEKARQEHLASAEVAGGPTLPRFANCGAHGVYPLYDIDDRGVTRWHSDGCPTCRTQRRVEQLMSRAAIPERHAGCNFDNFVVLHDGQKRALAIARQYAEQFASHRKSGASLLFLGNQGTGKNHLSAAIGKAILTQGFSVLHATAFEVTGKIKATWSKRDGESQRTQPEVINDFASVDLLILDEVGRGVSPRVDAPLLFSVIDQRYQQCRPTLVISNFGLDVVEQWLTPPGLDRLREGGGDCVRFDWRSVRGCVIS